MSLQLLTTIAAALAAMTALVVCVFAQPIGERLGLMDKPDGEGGRKRHSRPTPLVGGVALVAATLPALVAGATLAMPGGDPGHVVWLLVAVLVMFGIGAADDRFHLSPTLRLGIVIPALLLVISMAPGFALESLRFSGSTDLFQLGVAGGALFSVLCLVGLLNAVNMADGKNGVVVGQGLIWTVVLAAHAPASVLPVLVASAVALAVLWGFNLAGRLFLGDGGSYALSALIGLGAIYVYNRDSLTLRADEVALLFAIPVFDTIRLMAVRMARRRSPFEGDRDHFHHHLYEALDWPRGLWVYLAIVALPNAGALIWPGTAPMWLVVSFVAYAGALLMTRQTSRARDPAE